MYGKTGERILISLVAKYGASACACFQFWLSTGLWTKGLLPTLFTRDPQIKLFPNGLVRKACGYVHDACKAIDNEAAILGRDVNKIQNL
jgi:hypothetical protein